MTSAPIQIRNPEVVRDIRRLADKRGLSITAVVAEAVRRALVEQEARAEGATTARAQQIAAALAAIDALPHAGRPLGDDELYDEHGLPR